MFSANEERFDPLTYVEGGPAEQPGQVTLDEATADREGYKVGDEILIGGREPAARATRSPASRTSATRSRSASRA